MLYWRDPNEKRKEENENLLDEMFKSSELPDDLKKTLLEILGVNNPLAKKFPVGSNVKIKLSERELVKVLSSRCGHLCRKDVELAAADLVSGQNIVISIQDLEIGGKTTPLVLVGNARTPDVYPFYENEVELM